MGFGESLYEFHHYDEEYGYEDHRQRRSNHPADHASADRLLAGRTGTRGNRQRHHAKNERQRRHHDRPQSQTRCLQRRIDPGAPVSGNPYRNAAVTLPITWPEAALKFENSGLLREYFGEKFHRLFVTTRRGELQAFESHITPLEYAWYARTC